MYRVTDKKNFTEEVLNAPGLRVVEFYTDWSGPCQIMVPIYKDLSQTYSKAAKFFKIDVEASPLLKKQLGVIELPTILFYKNGILIDFVNGIISKKALTVKLENIINQKPN